MSEVACKRCGAAVEPDDEHMDIEIVVLHGESREVIEEVSLCASCAHELEDHLAVETVWHEQT